MIVCSKPYECKHYPTGVVCAICENGERFCPRTMTNADRVRAMTDEGLADFITDDMCELLCGSPMVCEGQCKQKMLDWLKQEANDET